MEKGSLRFFARRGFLAFLGLFVVSCILQTERVPPSFRPDFLVEDAKDIVVLVLSNGKQIDAFRYDGTARTGQNESEHKNLRLEDFGIYDPKPLKNGNIRLPRLETLHFFPVPTNLIFTLSVTHPKGMFFVPVGKSLPKPTLRYYQRYRKLFYTAPVDSKNHVQLKLHAPEMLIVGKNTSFRVYADLFYPKEPSENRYFRIVSHVSDVGMRDGETDHELIYRGVEAAERQLFGYLFPDVSPEKD